MALSLPEKQTGLKEEATRLLATIDDAQELTLSSSSQEEKLSPELSQLFTGLLQKLASGQQVEVQAVKQELTTTEAAHRLGISRPTLVKLIKDGDLPAHKVGSHFRIDIADLQTYVEVRYQKKVQQIQGLWDFEAEHQLEELL